MNWKTIIAELQACGFTQPQIAFACGCAQATISDLATGKSTEPRHSLGQSILALHKDRADKRLRTQPEAA
jgi:transcriptional regulator with XRE-family HTH domain